jgi:hypothetical protein
MRGKKEKRKEKEKGEEEEKGGEGGCMAVRAFETAKKQHKK